MYRMHWIKNPLGSDCFLSVFTKANIWAPSWLGIINQMRHQPRSYNKAHLLKMYWKLCMRDRTKWISEAVSPLWTNPCSLVVHQLRASAAHSQNKFLFLNACNLIISYKSLCIVSVFRGRSLLHGSVIKSSLFSVPGRNSAMFSTLFFPAACFNLPQCYFW